MVKNEVSSVKSLALHLRLSVMSFMYTRMKSGSKLEP